MTSFLVTDLPELILLRNKLWEEIYRFLSALLEHESDDCENTDNNHMQDPFLILVNILNECNPQAFLQSICESISNKQSDG